MKKTGWIVFVLVLLGGAGYVGWKAYGKMSQQDPAAQRKRPPVPVEVSPVVSMTLRDVETFSGTLLPRSQFVVAPRVGGRLLKLAVNIGDAVSPGQLVAELDDEEYGQQVDRAQAELLVAQAGLEECHSNRDAAKRDLDRITTLRRGNVASVWELDQAQSAYEVQLARCRVADATIKQREAALKEARIRLAYTKIHAEFTGGDAKRYVGERHVDEGALLAPNAPIVSLLDISRLTALIGVIESDYSRISINQQASITTDAYPGRTFTGRVVRVAPLLEEASRQGRVEIEIDNPELLLKPGLFVRVRLEFAVHEQAPTVPVSALVRREGTQGVFVADVAGKKARFVPVQTGIRQGQDIEIVSPSLGGPVVVLGQHLLQDGSDIDIVPPTVFQTAAADTATTAPASPEAPR